MPSKKISTAASNNKAATPEALKKEIASLTQENQQLKGTITRLKSPAHTSEDFASALQHAVDILQQRFASMTNPINDFALREFRIEANVFVDVNTMGQVRYRFIQPGENVDPQNVSKITLDIVPIPKQTQAGSWTKGNFSPQASLEEIYGIEDKYRKVLNKNQLYTIGDLLMASTRLRNNVELASVLGVDRKKMADWLSQAELLTVSGVDGHIARVLSDINIKNLAQLAKTQPSDLVQKFNKHIAVKPDAAKAIDEETAKGWIGAAKQFVGFKSQTPG